MIKKSLFFLLIAVISISTYAQQDTTAVGLPQGSHLRISLLTCGPGEEEVYEVFGHTAVRVVDSSADAPFNDLVYNYGMFSYGDDYVIKFLRGKLPYYVASHFFSDFMQEYVELGRSVQEQVLMVSDSAKEEINAYLQENCLPQNRYYKYDFFFDNCATRIRDIFPLALGSGFVYGDALQKDKGITFRGIVNRYFYRRHWERVGVNILLGSKIDKVMTNTDIMFLPDYLRDGLAGAKLNGKNVAMPPELLLDGSKHKPAGLNLPLLLTSALLLLTVLGLTIKKLQLLGRIMSALLLVVSGLLGILMLVMWFATDHQGCADNFNILWALPLNIFVAFARPRRRDKYAAIAILLIVVSLLLHVLQVQGIVVELLPLMLALVFVHGSVYRKSKILADNG